MEVGVILATLLLLVMLFFIIRLVVGPLKVLSRLFVNCAIALVALIVINFIGSYIGIHLPINPVSVIGIGILGIPGLLLFAFLSYLFI
ncbi:pro-sigmaK processing inhibitor BofA [Thermanaerosceptrum fracticalcis]|uniref:Pro-sigmaK processing inhibitor BofA n=1 Tax=Thermanaerosceptrum fracticalcis TaxID=1712410 RepID=A0A7G6E5A3_THEFR|nr:pro-sigmaK processing inhibitor BofA family protein [Thermanaerosceptrum fracticalcis]QNB47257.1 pro-sigmaK processing inhibitor BofA [Thermanaerosceptrum fracticalcis]